MADWPSAFSSATTSIPRWDCASVSENTLSCLHLALQAGKAKARRLRKISPFFAAWPLARAEYLRAQQENDAAAKVFYSGDRMNKSRVSRMNDFANLPITQWPSVAAYDAFKEYYYASNMLLQTPVGTDTSIKVEDRIRAYQGKLEALQKALDAARR